MPLWSARTHRGRPFSPCALALPLGALPTTLAGGASMAIAGVFGASGTAARLLWHHLPFRRPPGESIMPKWLKTLVKAVRATWRPDRCAAPRRPLESHPRNRGQFQNLRVLRCRCWRVPGLLWLYQLPVSPLQEHIFFLGSGSFFWGVEASE